MERTPRGPKPVRNLFHLVMFLSASPAETPPPKPRVYVFKSIWSHTASGPARPDPLRVSPFFTTFPEGTGLVQSQYPASMLFPVCRACLFTYVWRDDDKVRAKTLTHVIAVSFANHLVHKKGFEESGLTLGPIYILCISPLRLLDSR